MELLACQRLNESLSEDLSLSLNLNSQSSHNMSLYMQQSGGGQNAKSFPTIDAPSTNTTLHPESNTEENPKTEEIVLESKSLQTDIENEELQESTFLNVELMEENERLKYELDQLTEERYLRFSVFLFSKEGK